MIKTKPSDSTVTYCYSYHRISSKQQLKGGGIKRQMEESQKYCDEQGWTMETTFKLTDIGTSAYHSKNLDDRAALGSFLNAVDHGMIRRPAVLLVENLDRLSRANIMDALELFIRILNSGISICTYHDRMLYSKESLQSNFSPLLISITIMSRSHEESAIKSRRKKTSWRHMREGLQKGKIGSKKIYPNWITIDSGEPKIIEEKAQVIREIFRLSTEHNMSFIDISHKINEIYGESVNASPYYIQRLFSSKMVLGIYAPEKGKLGIEINAYPAIISEEVYYKSRSLVELRKKTKVGRPAKYGANYFKSVIMCGHCQHTMRVIGNNSKGYFRCRAKTALKLDCRQNSTIDISPTQAALIYTLSLINKDDIIGNAATNKKTKLRAFIDSSQEMIADKETQIDNLAVLVAAGTKKGAQMVAQLEIEIEKIEIAVTNAKEELEFLNSSIMSSSLTEINRFNELYALGKMTKNDQDPFILALRKFVDAIYIYSPEKKDERSTAIIDLLSGTQIKVVIAKDYSAEIYKGNKRIGMYTPKG